MKVLMRVVECMRYLQDEWPEVDYELNTSSILLSDNVEPLISRFKVGDQNSNRRSKNNRQLSHKHYFFPCAVSSFFLFLWHAC